VALPSLTLRGAVPGLGWQAAFLTEGAYWKLKRGQTLLQWLLGKPSPLPFPPCRCTVPAEFQPAKFLPYSRGTLMGPLWDPQATKAQCLSLPRERDEAWCLCSWPCSSCLGLTASRALSCISPSRQASTSVPREYWKAQGMPEGHPALIGNTLHKQHTSTRCVPAQARRE